MILSLGQRSCCSTLAFIAILFTLLSLAASHGHHGSPSSTPSTPSSTVSNCSAAITINSTEPSTAFYIYHDIIVENTGLCDITKVFVNITLPPDDTVFAYYNVSNSTGELSGLESPMPQGRVEVGGTIVLNSARLPIIVVSQLECSSTCNAASAPSAGISSAGNNPSDSSVPTDLPTGSSDEASSADASSGDAPVDATSSTETSSADESSDSASSEIQVEIKRGSNAYWLGLNVLSGGEVAGPRKVQFRDSSSDASWVRMDSANWGNAPTFTYSPTHGPLVLPISLRITFSSNEVTILDDVITSFSSSQTSAAPEGIDA